MRDSTRELRRWTRLKPEILRPCTVALVSPMAMAANLADLSPGGIGLTLPPQATGLEPGLEIRVRIHFVGQELVERTGVVRSWNGAGHLGIEWPSEPSPWNGLERRERSRIPLGVHSLGIRLPLPHAHRIWTRCAIINLDADLGFQVETVGGPSYLLPGHLARLHLDLAYSSDQTWECQVLWCRPGEGQSIRMGLRLLERDPHLQDALGGWLELHGVLPPLVLQSMGLRDTPPAGQFRSRKVEERGEFQAVGQFLQAPAGISEGIRIGLWDGGKLVGGAELVVDPEEQRTIIRAFRILPAWMVPDAFLGLWEQMVRHFLATGTGCLELGNLHDQSLLLHLGGFRYRGPCASIPRDTILWGQGLGAIRWMHLYGDVSGFARIGARFPGMRLWTGSWVRRVIWMVLRDWREPAVRSRLHREIELWSRDRGEDSSVR